MRRLHERYIPDDLVAFYEALYKRMPDVAAYYLRNPARKRVFDHVVNLVRSYGGVGRTCLEVGCSTGEITAAIHDAFESVVAVDMVRSALRWARKRKLTNVTFTAVTDLAKFLKAVAERGGVDVIVASEVLEHTRHPAAILDLMLHAAEIVIVSVPTNEEPNPDAFNLDLLGRERKAGDATGHIWYFTHDSFLTFCDAVIGLNPEARGLLETAQVEMSTVAVLRGDRGGQYAVHDGESAGSDQETA